MFWSFPSLGIIHQNTCIHTPQWNGIPEHKHRHILEVVRSLRFQLKAPLKFLGEYVTIACYIIKILPTLVLQWKTPFEILYKKVPNLSQMSVFGCLGYATNTNYHDKFSPKAVPSVFFGYSSTQKLYILFNLTTKSLFINRDVIFSWNNIPFYFSIVRVFIFFPLNIMFWILIFPFCLFLLFNLFPFYLVLDSLASVLSQAPSSPLTLSPLNFHLPSLPSSSISPTD